MFDMLISRKKTVAIRCGSNDITGIISNFYKPFGLLKINNLLLPLEHIESITVLDENAPSPYSGRGARCDKRRRQLQPAADSPLRSRNGLFRCP